MEIVACLRSKHPGPRRWVPLRACRARDPRPPGNITARCCGGPRCRGGPSHRGSRPTEPGRPFRSPKTLQSSLRPADSDLRGPAPRRKGTEEVVRPQAGWVQLPMPHARTDEHLHSPNGLARPSPGHNAAGKGRVGKGVGEKMPRIREEEGSGTQKGIKGSWGGEAGEETKGAA